MKRKNTAFAKTLSAFLALALAGTVSTVPVFAAGIPVRIETEDIREDSIPLHSLTISGITAPAPGMALDGTAGVTTLEGVSWDIPVLWLDSAGNLAKGTAGEGIYRPVLAFYLPRGYHIGDEACTVTLQESLLPLFWGQIPLSVYDSSIGLTLIFSGAADFSSDPGEEGKAVQNPIPGLPEELMAPRDGTYRNPVYPGNAAGDENSEEYRDRKAERDELLTTLVKLHCSQTARDALSEKDLKTLTELIVLKIEPQAVNLLTESFPSFKEAAKKDELGRKISLYIYYEKGDDDGHEEHKGIPNALAYVSGAPFLYKDGSFTYEYLIGVDAASFSKKGEDGKAVLDPSEKTLADLDNTVIHELFHAFMDDYNRVGMSGGTGADELFYDNGLSREEVDRINRETRFPNWFIEGSASATENVYQYRYETFQLLRNDYETNNPAPRYTPEILRRAYEATDYRGTAQYYDLEYSDEAMNGDNDPSKYVSGYLACLYLGELAAEKEGTTAFSRDAEGNTAISSKTIRLGFDRILNRLHKGETLDGIIKDISSGSYKDTDDFTKTFIKGRDDGHVDASALFCTDYLNYMLDLNDSGKNKNLPNGSILKDFDQDYTTPLDRTKDATSEFYIITGDNEYIPSTVPNETALTNGGKSRTGAKEESAGEAEGTVETEKTAEAEETAKARIGETAAKTAEAAGKKAADTSPVMSTEKAAEPAGEKAAGVTAEKAVEETEDTTKEAEAVTVEPEVLTEESEAVTVEPEVLTEESEAVAVEAEDITEETEVLTEEAEDVTVEAEAVIEEAEDMAVEAEDMAVEAEAVIEEAEVVIEEAEAVTVEAEVAEEESGEESENAPEESGEPPEEPLQDLCS